MTSPGHPLPPNSPSASLRARLHDATRLLESIAADRSVLAGVPPEDRQRLLGAVASVYSPDRVERRRMARVTARARKAARVKQTEILRDQAAIRSRRRSVFHSPNVFLPADSTEDRGDGAPPSSVSTLPGAAIGAAREAADAQHCYVCKQAYSVIHHFYDQLCPSCAELNFFKRTELADLRGRVALLTGGRVKIGFQAGLKLLRSGAHLFVTTRFPRNAARRYASEPDFADWKDRLEIFGLDLRHTPSVDAFCRELLSTCRRLDFIVNNACQTVRRPPEFYAHMMAEETSAFRDMPRDVRQLVVRYEELCRHEALPGTSAYMPRRDGVERASADRGVAGLAAAAAQLSQVPLLPEEFFDQRALFPRDQLDHDLQQVDLRQQNSWRLLLADVSTVELLEVHLVNAIGPFVINARLKPLLVRTPERDKHIVNVSAVEGQFYRRFKTTRHPHTNMAKAALNMMTRTSAADYHQDGIHMNSVDTGWVTDEDTVEIACRKTAEQRFHPPLDIVDGAARIVDPIVSGFNSGTHVWGQFLKDFRATDW